MNGGKMMRTFSYKKLFKKLIDLDMTNNELMEKANISKSTFYKIKNGQNVTTDVLPRYIVPFISMIQSVSSLKLFDEISRQASKVGRTVPVLLEVHIASEDTKSGFTPEELPQVLAAVDRKSVV